MKYLMRAAGAALVVTLALSPAGALAQTPGHPPVEAFGQLPNLRQPALSPDGKHALVIQAYRGRPVLCIYTLGAPSGTTPAIVNPSDWFIGRAFWAKNDRIVVYLTKDAKLSYGYVKARELVAWNRAVAIDIDGGNLAALFVHNTSSANNIRITGMLDLGLDDPDNVYIPFYAYSNLLSPSEEAMRAKNNQSDDDLFQFNLYKVNVRTGDATGFEAGTHDTREWFMDGHGHVLARLDRGWQSLEDHVRAFDNGSWKDIATYDASGNRGAGLQGVSGDGLALVRYVEADDGGTSALSRVDLATGKETPLFRQPDYDVSGVLGDDWTGRIVGVTYTDDRPEFVYFDPKREALQRGVEAAFPGMIARAVSQDLAGDIAIIGAESPRRPPAFYTLDRNTHQAVLIGSTYPGLSEADLGETTPYPYAARDGLAIHAFLTLPPGKIAKNLPTVIFPHDESNGRDGLNFNWWVQFMANRGYAVLQPNFRGSNGYGAKFAHAGYRQWGLKMQDDITDGVKKLVADGIADPKRVCIVGASYGGYAALAGATFTPDLYACAVSFAGVADLPQLVRYYRNRANDDAAMVSALETLIGDSDDPDPLRATSPAYHADRVRCPILLLHADGDTTVPIAQSQEEADALSKAGKSVKFVQIEGDDHYLRLATTRVRLLQEIESFLSANIGN